MVSPHDLCHLTSCRPEKDAVSLCEAERDKIEVSMSAVEVLTTEVCTSNVKFCVIGFDFLVYFFVELHGVEVDKIEVSMSAVEVLTNEVWKLFKLDKVELCTIGLDIPMYVSQRKPAK